ncbi:MAG: PQQ-binding-like beta-propeller repeat protein [Elusimicrobiota bacterium]
MNRRFKIFLIIVSFIFIMKTPGETKSWPMFMGNRARTGYTYEQAGGTLTVQWHYDKNEMLFSDVVASPVVKDGIVYIATLSGAVYAFNAKTGGDVWQESLENAEDIYSTPAVENGSIYVFSKDNDSGEAYSFDAADGENINWNIEFKGQNVSSPLISDGYIYIGRGGQYTDIKGIRLSDGNVVYSFDTGQPVQSSPLLYNGQLYIACNNGSIYRLDKQLNKIWQYSTGTGLFRLSSVSAGNDKLYCAPGDALRRVYALDIDDPHNGPGWQSQELNTGGTGVYTSSVAMDEDNLYVVMASSVQVMYCLDRSNGNLNWSYELYDSSTTDYILSSPAVTYDTVYVGSESGYLTCLSTSGAVLNSYLVDSSSSAVVVSPGVSDGYVFVVTRSGAISAYKASRITCIASPDNEDITTSGIITVRGTALNPDFQNYILYFGTGTNPSNWHAISTSTVQVDDGTLGSLDSSNLLDGEYTLRLTVNNTSEPGEARNMITIDNPPDPPASVKAAARPFGSIKLDWTKSSDDGAGSNDVEGYKIFRKGVTGNFDYNMPVTTVVAGIETYTDTDISIGQEYFYALRSYDARNDSPDSVVVSTITYKNIVTINAVDGGTVELSDGTGVYFPPGALKQNSEVAITFISESNIPSGIQGDYSSRWNPVGKAWEFEIQPDEAFNTNVTVKLSYDDSDITGMNEENMRMYWYDKSGSIWRIVDTSVPYPNQNQVYAYVPHFTIYRPAEYIPPEYIISKNSAYVYPNPASGSEVTFKFIVTRAADIELRVFNVAGELIKEFAERYEAEDAGKTQEIKWNINGIASGVYIWYLKGKTPYREDEVTEKLAIIK